jgi:hypothetical protein
VGGEFGIPASRQALIENARRVLSPAQIEALINYEIRLQAQKQHAKK